MRDLDHRSKDDLPLLNHHLDAPSVFTPENLIDAVQSTRNIQQINLPDVCILEFDGDLTDKLKQQEKLQYCDSWPCFHTDMWCWQQDEIRCGIIPRTIGGSYTVLVAEQLAVCGVKVVIGLTSAGRIDPSLPLPSVVIAESAIRDEGVSHHYLPLGKMVEATQSLIPYLKNSLNKLGEPVRCGLVWTTDAPYRETQESINCYVNMGALAVEMQAASLFAFGKRKNFPVALIAHVTNATDYNGKQFEKGPNDFDISLLHAVCTGANQWLEFL